MTKPAPQAPSQLSGAALRLKQHERKSFIVKAPPGASQDDVRGFAFWALVAGKLRRHDEVTILAPLEDWEMEVRIDRAVPGEGCDISVARKFTRKGVHEARVAIDDHHFIEYAGSDGWCVYRLKDEVRLMAGLATAESARAQFFREAPRVA